MAHVDTDVSQREKTVQGVYRPGSTHMVGDGFPVRNLFPSNDLDREVDPVSDAGLRRSAVFYTDRPPAGRRRAPAPGL